MKSPVKYLTDEEYSALPIEERVLHVARSKVGVREAGRNRGHWVSRFLASVGLGPGYAWCAAFVSWCIEEAGGTKGRYGPWPKWKRAAVRYWASHAVWRGDSFDLNHAKRGMLLYWVYKNGQGHIGFITGVDTDSRGNVVAIRTIEGNTNKAGSREGDGVYDKTRAVNSLRRRYHVGVIQWWK